MSTALLSASPSPTKALDQGFKLSERPASNQPAGSGNSRVIAEAVAKPNNRYLAVKVEPPIAQAPSNEDLATEAKSVFDKLLNTKYEGGETITDPQILKFARKVLENKEYSFDQQLAGGVDVRFLNSHGKNFSFYKTRTRSSQHIAERNARGPLTERLPEVDTKDTVQIGTLTINKFSDTDIHISVSDIQKGTITKKGFSLVA